MGTTETTNVIFVKSEFTLTLYCTRPYIQGLLLDLVSPEIIQSR